MSKGVDVATEQKLSEKQCRVIIGGTIGSLCYVADAETIKAAVKTWVGNVDSIDDMHKAVARPKEREKS